MMWAEGIGKSLRLFKKINHQLVDLSPQWAGGLSEKLLNYWQGYGSLYPFPPPLIPPTTTTTKIRELTECPNNGIEQFMYFVFFLKTTWIILFWTNVDSQEISKKKKGYKEILYTFYSVSPKHINFHYYRTLLKPGNGYQYNPYISFSSMGLLV